MRFLGAELSVRVGALPRDAQQVFILAVQILYFTAGFFQVFLYRIHFGVSSFFCLC